MKKIPQLTDGPDDGAPDDVPSADDAVADGAADAPSGPLADVRDALSRGALADDGSTSGTARGSGPAQGTAGDTAPAGGGRNAARGGRRKARGGSTARGPARRFARERALQALYQWDMADAESSTVRREFIERQDMSRVDVDYFERLFRGISHDVEKVDATLADALDRPLGDVDPIERAVLRIAAFELAEVLETPARVVINEGVEITKRFGADNGHRYVNGVLDGLAATLRPLEMRRG